MRRFGLIAVIVVTALISCALTSAFWMVAFNRGPVPEGASVAAPAAPPDGTPRADLVKGPTGLAIPVAGIQGSELSDTYTQSRAGGARVHNAIDIMASAGTPVVAAAPGTVEKLFFSAGGGGITAYVRSPDKAWTYYYAHLQAYAPGLREGQVVKQGDAIGTVGATGNANPAGPHLHFAINRMAEGEDWHEGTPINPYPLLAGNGPRR
ncbi:M23 family metallopeptidase [Allosphingosinicella deserti]|uniref:Peptidase M23 n=1 Tax=Allosphingosinicella deserti TaxID=2116704 RepID=A0A2P7QPV3_9SPHN|nr:M23 family metallopeptidase [Sphingomonas deserti]PSJ39999.1 peptidase M23 [Sphingomonas deserti]